MKATNHEKKFSRHSKFTTVSELEDRVLGPVGTPEREAYEYELKMEILAEKIRELRKMQNLTQDQLGEKIGVKKAQISKIEKSAKNTSLDTLNKIFQALHAKVTFQIHTEEGAECAVI